MGAIHATMADVDLTFGQIVRYGTEMHTASEVATCTGDGSRRAAFPVLGRPPTGSDPAKATAHRSAIDRRVVGAELRTADPGGRDVPADCTITGETTFSSSTEPIHSPPDLMMSLSRLVMRTTRSLSIVAGSLVRRHPRPAYTDELLMSSALKFDKRALRTRDANGVLTIEATSGAAG